MIFDIVKERFDDYRLSLDFVVFTNICLIQPSAFSALTGGALSTD